MNKSNITIIGAGKVGQSLYAKLQQNSATVRLVGKDLNEQQQSCAESDLTLICVQDREIENVCLTISPWLKANSVVAHCSGSLNSQILVTARNKSCHIGCAHPLNSFPTVEAAIQSLSAENHATHCFISGDEEAQNTLRDLFQSIGFVTALIDDADKIKYHAACVFLCNYLTSLSEIGLGLAEQAGLERESFWQAVQPLIKTTLSNITQHGTVGALSGPIARGDVNTVAAHVHALADADPMVLKAYKTLGLQAIALSKQQNLLTPNVLNKLDEALS